MNRLEKCEKLEKISISDLGNFKLEFEKPTKSLRLLKDGNHFAWVFPSNNENQNEIQSPNEIQINTKEDYNIANKIIERYEKVLGERIDVLYLKDK